MGMVLEDLDKETISFQEFKESLLSDYSLAFYSRQLGLIGRKEVLTGKAKFGIFGDGIELAQIVLAKFFQKGDYRSGYYRDQCLMMALGELTGKELFASLYANNDVSKDPGHAGRQMVGHFSTPFLDTEGNWLDQTSRYNSSSDISTTSGNMPRLLGLALASKYYKNLDELKDPNLFSKGGNEVVFGTIGDSSTSEGNFFEIINAAGVLQVPMVLSVWDNGYGISVPKEIQTTKGSISEVLSGFQKTELSNGFEIFTVKGWDFLGLMETYKKATKIAREQHVPIIVHVQELTQPQGHSTSGSHERYKSEERLTWEKEYDCLKKFKEFILNYTIDGTSIITEEELEAIEKEQSKKVKQETKEAFTESQMVAKQWLQELLEMYPEEEELKKISEKRLIWKSDTVKWARQKLWLKSDSNTALQNWLDSKKDDIYDFYHSHLNSETQNATIHVPYIEPKYTEESELVDGRVILRDNFDQLFSTHPELVTFGEDTGKIGGVNQCLEGLQDKYGELRVRDTGIHETAIVGEAIGMAMRGLRPIAEIQYLDYIFYATPTLSDDLATLHYRTKGQQKAPVIIRTRGHRLEGIWHSGSPMGSLLTTFRGIHILVPRNNTKAAGFYNTLLKSDDPAIVVESLNGYRIKEKMPSNLGEFTTPVGKVEVLEEGTDITIVTYGSMCRIVAEAVKKLKEININCELIDCQSLYPFDLEKDVLKSIKKTNKLLICDEDLPGGATSYLLNEIVVNQGAFEWLDCSPKTLTAANHRPACSSDGDYFSKPNVEDISEAVIQMMKNYIPSRF